MRVIDSHSRNITLDGLTRKCDRTTLDSSIQLIDSPLLGNDCILVELDGLGIEFACLESEVGSDGLMEGAYIRRTYRPSQ